MSTETMMSYGDTGLEEEADYEDEYTVGGTMTENIDAPIYNPGPPNENRYVNHDHDESTSAQSIPKVTDNNSHSYVYQQLQPGPQIQQVFDDYNPVVTNGHSYIPSGPQREPVIQQLMDGETQDSFIEEKNTQRYPSRNSWRQREKHPSSTAASIQMSEFKKADEITTLSKANASEVIAPKMPIINASGIPTLQVPTGRIPKKKKVQELEQAIATTMLTDEDTKTTTEEQWNRINTSLKEAEAHDNFPLMISTLKLLIQSDVNTGFITSNDTPKIVRKLSRSSKNSEAKDLALQCVNRWKKEINDEKKLGKSEASVTKGKSIDKRLTDRKDKYTNINAAVSSIIQDNDSPEAKKKKLENSFQTKKTDVKKLPPIPKKVNAASLSSGFMDALTSEPPKKKVTSKKKTESRIIANDPLSVLDVMNDSKPQASSPPTQDNRRRTPSPIMEDIPVKANRKIKFADECGKEIVEIKYFEVEEGERINVTRMSPDEMKHHEAQMERQLKNRARSVYDDDEKEVPWRLIPIDKETLNSMERGCNSEAKLIEDRRQMSSLRAFCDPTKIIYLVNDPEDYDPNAVYPEPKKIPLYTDAEMRNQVTTVPAPVPVPVSVPTAEEPKANPLPSHLQNLLNGLKSQGIVGRDSGTAVTSSITSIPGLSSIIIASQAANISQAPIPIPQFQQVTQPPYAPFPSASYPVPFPSVQHQPLQSNITTIPLSQLQHRITNPGTSTGPRSVLCHNYRSGSCRFGERCRFSHDLNGVTSHRDFSRNTRNDSYHDRGKPYGRRDFRDRRDYRDRDRDWDRDRYRDDNQSSRSPGDIIRSPNVSQSPIKSPPIDGQSPRERIHETVTIPAERVD